MADRDLTAALADLLSDPALRRAYADDPAAVARQLGVGDADRPAFLVLDRQGLEAQANSLVNKRLHEVTGLLPVTFTRLGAEAGRLFRAYADTQWPEGHTRHVTDAVSFCQYLKIIGLSDKVCGLELQWLTFRLSKRRISITWVNDIPVRDRLRPGLQILVRKPNRDIWQSVLFLR